MTRKYDGGPAFPPMHNPDTHQSGMSLRDWFAGQALAGLLADPNVLGGAPEVANTAYRFADAMLEARAAE
jgi:hypothetical protein